MNAKRKEKESGEQSGEEEREGKLGNNVLPAFYVFFELTNFQPTASSMFRKGTAAKGGKGQG